MKHLTLLFCRVLSGLYQQGVFPAGKKDLLLQAWQEAVKASDKKKLKTLLLELASINTNQLWKTELNRALEEL